MEIRVPYGPVSQQTDEATVILPSGYSWSTIARQCLQHPDWSCGQITACLLREGPAVTAVERSYMEDLVFACILGQKKLATHFVAQLNTVRSRSDGGEADLRGILAALSEQSGRCLGDPQPGAESGDDDEYL